MRLAVSPKRGVLQIGLALLAGLAFAHSAKATGWNEGSPAFANSSNVSVVASHPYDPNQAAAVVNNTVQITTNGGGSWTASSLTSVNAIVYDTAYPGVVYAGTNTGMRKSTDYGVTWASFGNAASLSISVTSIALDKNYIYSLEYDGSATRVYRFDRTGSTTQLTFPTTTASGVAVDQQSGAVYIGSTSNLYTSTDYGGNWGSPLYSSASLGNVRKIVAKKTKIWLLGTKGVFYSNNTGSSFSGLVTSSSGAPSGISTDFAASGMDPRALFVSHDVAYVAYKVVSPYTSFMSFSVTTGGTVTALDQPQFAGPLYGITADMAGSGNTIWLAADNTAGYGFGVGGLYKRTDLTTTEAAITRPVLVVPGIMGSWKVGGTWTFDPIMHNYDSLLGLLRNAGYSDNTTLFTWAYDWRQGYATSAGQLATKIAQIKVTCACSSIDVIGYDTGGLVARSYIEGSSYASDVANLVLLGTPNSGTVEAYSLYQAGSSTSPDPAWRLARWVLGVEAAENHLSLSAYIQASVPGISEALPVFSYLDGFIYPTSHPSNSFLTTLNNGTNLALLGSRTRVINVGSNGSSTTLGSLSADLATLHRTGTGDGSVLLSSLSDATNPDLVLTASHIGLIRRPSNLWLPLLLGGPISVTAPSVSDSSLLVMYVKSPVKLSITDPASKQISDLLNQISGAFYSGSSASAQFLVIPGFTPGIYQTVLDAVGAGSYSVGVAQIMASFGSDAAGEYTGSVVLDQQDQLTYNSATNSWALVTQTIPPQPSSGGGTTSEPDQPIISSTPATKKAVAIVRTAPAEDTVELAVVPSQNPPRLLPLNPEVPKSEASPVWWGWLLIGVLLLVWAYLRGRRHERYRLRL